MPKPNHVSKSELFQKLLIASNEVKEKRDCSVMALAVVTESTYKQAHAAMKANHRKDRQGAYLMDLFRALEAMGFDHNEIEPQYFISDYPKPHARLLKHVTSHHPDRFPDSWGDGKTYLISTPRHFLAVVDGVTHDWSRNHKKQARAIYCITPNAKAATS